MTPTIALLLILALFAGAAVLYSLRRVGALHGESLRHSNCGHDARGSSRSNL